MKISELAKRTGVSTHALRHYERLGLLEPVRHANGYRDYPESMRREVVFIAMSRKIGFSLAAITERLPTHHANGVRNEHSFCRHEP
jgi:DNA-binding transcriptional MerR regulator